MAALPAQAAPGDLDRSFSGDGKALTDFPPFSRSSFGNDVAVQGNGKAVVAGEVGFDRDIAVARYTRDGRLDERFSGDGRTTTNVGVDDIANAVAVQPDGRIVIAGYTEETDAGPGDFVVARYTPDGSPDTTFAGDGVKVTDFAGGADEAQALAIQPDGKIVVAGRGGAPAGPSRFALARYNPGGRLDRTFSGDGKEVTPTAGSTAYSVALQDDGKIVAAGRAGSIVDGDFAVARYRSNGALDPDFSEDGVTMTDFAGGDDVAEGLALQEDDRVVVAGSADTDSRGPDFALARYRPNGSPDASFSGDGKLTTDFPDRRDSGGRSDGDAARDVALQEDGKIVAVGNTVPGRNYRGASDFALARYRPSGRLDQSFGGNGRKTTHFKDSADGEVAHGVAIQGDGKIVAAGEIRSSPGSTGDVGRFAIARYRP